METSGLIFYQKIVKFVAIFGHLFLAVATFFLATKKFFEKIVKFVAKWPLSAHFLKVKMATKIVKNITYML